MKNIFIKEVTMVIIFLLCLVTFKIVKDPFLILLIGGISYAVLKGEYDEMRRKENEV